MNSEQVSLLIKKPFASFITLSLLGRHLSPSQLMQKIESLHSDFEKVDAPNDLINQGIVG